MADSKMEFEVPDKTPQQFKDYVDEIEKLIDERKIVKKNSMAFNPSAFSFSKQMIFDCEDSKFKLFIDYNDDELTDDFICTARMDLSSPPGIAQINFRARNRNEDISDAPHFDTMKRSDTEEFLSRYIDTVEGLKEDHFIIIGGRKVIETYGEQVVLDSFQSGFAVAEKTTVITLKLMDLPDVRIINQ